ncbi:MAG TPA: OsmC family protein [Terriglobales bacterium]|nr:OsmC family protein [Terriglobales bacterium]
MKDDSTMGQQHEYRVVAWWSSGRTGLAKSDSALNAIHFTAPPEFGGLEGRWTPEELLLSALASCYTTTFRVIAGYAKFSFADLEVAVEGVIQKLDSGYGFREVTIQPKLTILREDDRERALDLLNRAKQLCLVARALAIEQKFEPKVEAGELSGTR